MSINKKLLKQLLADGASMEDLQTAYNEILAEEEAERKKQHYIDETKENLSCAFMEYLEALDVINIDTPDDKLDEYAKLISRTIDTWQELFTKGKVTLTQTLPKNAAALGFNSPFYKDFFKNL